MRRNRRKKTGDDTPKTGATYRREKKKFSLQEKLKKLQEGGVDRVDSRGYTVMDLRKVNKISRLRQRLENLEKS